MFIKWINDYRRCNDLFDLPVTLLLDSHNSRINYDAINLFARAGIRVITFPPHSTHAMQPFDVCIAKPLKMKYTYLYKRAISVYQKKTGIGKIPTPILREIAVRTIITSWKSVLTFENASCAFAKTGIYPFNPGVMLRGRQINTISKKDPEKEERRTSNRLFITSSELTNPIMLKKLKENKETELKKKRTKKQADKGKDVTLVFRNFLDGETSIKEYEALRNEHSSNKIPVFKGMEIMTHSIKENTLILDKENVPPHNSNSESQQLPCITVTKREQQLKVDESSSAPSPYRQMYIQH